MKINCLIIDDEPSSQTVLKNYIDKIDFLVLVNSCANAVEAMDFLSKENSIHLVFLDINMPKISGLSFYQSLQNPPAVIFTTAYSEYAIHAFDVNAIDYLLKPFSFDRFLKAVNKYAALHQSGKSYEKISSPVLIKADKKLHRISPDDILFIEAYGDYVKIHLVGTFLLTNNTFKNILIQLPSCFIQTHKSFAVNLEKATSVDGNQVIIHQQKIPIGMRFKTVFLERFKNQ